MLKFFRIPFATSGDRTAVPDAVDVNGFVSYTSGYGFDYQRQKTDPAAKNIERDKMNEIFFDITTAIGELQGQGVPDFITSALNGGTAYSYSQYALVRYSGDIYISLANTNTALPTDATKWALLPTPGRVQSGAYVLAATVGGTVDEITATFSPTLTALTTQRLRVRATGANTSATPTFAPDGLTAKTIVKGANSPLVAGDIAGAGAWLDLQYDTTLDKWVLLTPKPAVASASLATVTRYRTAGSGTYTVPAGVSKILIRAIGGGGGGGGDYGDFGSGGGGGSGGYCEKLITSPAASYAYVVGAAGTAGGGSGGTGGAGGNTTIAGMTAGGGGPGYGVVGAGGQGGSATGGDLNVAGGGGSSGGVRGGSSANSGGGNGGGGYWGGGGKGGGNGGGYSGGVGVAGGGGGGAGLSGAAAAGGAGLIEIWEFA